MESRRKAALAAFGDDSEAGLRLLLKQLPIAIVRLDRSGTVIDANDRFLALTGYSRDELPNLDAWWPLAYPDPARRQQAISEWTAVVTESIANGTPIPLREYRITCQGGREKTITACGLNLPESLVIVVEDITERCLAETVQQFHMHFLECMDRINLAIQGATSIDEMMTHVLDRVLDIFDCDRAYLHYPCDPQASEWWIPMERCREGFPSPLSPGQRVPMDAHVAASLAAMLASRGPIQIGPGTDYPIPAATSERLGVRSLLSMAIHPKSDRPWQFGIHQCAYARHWTDEEEQLFEEIGRRITDGLDTLLITQRLRESEERFRQVFENSPLPIQEEDYSAVKHRLDALPPAARKDLDAYLEQRPELLSELSGQVRIVTLNRSARILHEVADDQAPPATLAPSLLPETLTAFRKLLVALASGATEVRVDTVMQTRTGRQRQVSAYFAVRTGYEYTLGCLLVSLVDITERKEAEEQLVASEQVFRAMVENSPDFIARYDRQLRRLYLNPAIQALFTTPPAAALGQPPTRHSPLQDPEQYMANLRKAFEDGCEHADVVAYRDLEGNIHWGAMRAVPEFDAQGSVASVLAITRDITEHVLNEERLRLSASVFAASQEGILICDVDNRIIDVNPAFTQLTGYSRKEALGRNPSFLSSGRHPGEFYQAMWRALQSTGAWQGELWNRRKSGEAFAERLSIVAVKDERQRLSHYVGVFSDISQIKAHEADLDRIAHFDALTGLPNRRLLDDRLTQGMARARRHDTNLAICYLDLDGFKPINDQFDHNGGDLLLIEIARRLQGISRADDTVARMGGDEFVLLWNDVGSQDNCIRALKRVLAEISAPVLIDGIPVSVSASIGVTLFPEDNVDADSLLRHADHAMYSAKQLGKNRYQMFDAHLEQQMASRIEFLGKVGRALDLGQFEMFYQPKIDCLKGIVVGVEALLRWNEPILGQLTPKEFLPLIEDDNLVLRIGRWVMEQVIRQARQWHANGLNVTISINIFPRHLKFPSFVSDLRTAIATCWPDMPGASLMLEIVETSDIEELDPIENVIRQCLDMGIASSLDDFGTGYSSLIYLRRLSVKELKIDHSFVRNMLDDPEDDAIVVGIVGLGKAFGLRVVAEGVESPRHVRRLIELGCNIIQGHGVATPMPVAALENWLADFALHGVSLCK